MLNLLITDLDPLLLFAAYFELVPSITGTWVAQADYGLESLVYDINLEGQWYLCCEYFGRLLWGFFWWFFSYLLFLTSKMFFFLYSYSILVTIRVGIYVGTFFNSFVNWFDNFFFKFVKVPSWLRRRPLKCMQRQVRKNNITHRW